MHWSTLVFSAADLHTTYRYYYYGLRRVLTIISRAVWRDWDAVAAIKCGIGDQAPYVGRSLFCFFTLGPLDCVWRLIAGEQCGSVFLSLKKSTVPADPFKFSVNSVTFCVEIIAKPLSPAIWAYLSALHMRTAMFIDPWLTLGQPVSDIRHIYVSLDWTLHQMCIATVYTTILFYKWIMVWRWSMG